MTYLTVITTVLVATQVIRIVQNTINLHRQNKIVKKQFAGIQEITQEDLERQKKAYNLMIDYFESKKESGK